MTARNNNKMTDVDTREHYSKHSVGRSHTDDSVRATCKTCNATIGEFRNRWHGIAGAKNYTRPAVPGSFRVTGVTRARGKPQQARTFDQNLAGSELDSCQIRSLRCISCRHRLGFVCIDGPDDKSQIRGCEIFQPLTLVLTDKATNDVVEFFILEDPGGLPHDRRSSGMEEGQVTGSGEREASMSAPHDVPIRDSAPSQASRTLEVSYPPSSASNAQAASGRNANEVWSGAIARLQTQVSYNTSMLESHRRQLHDVEMAIGRLNQEMGAALNDLRAELRSRPVSAGQLRHDAADLDVLAEQIASVTSKVHDFDGLKMQFELMKNKMKRLEDQGSPAVPHLRPGSGSMHRESAFHEVPPPPPHQFPQPRPPPAQRQQLPSMRTSSMVSPIENRPTSYQVPPALPHVPTLESQGGPSYHPSSESRQYSNESSTMQVLQTGGFRPTEPLPPPSALSSWRPAEQMQQHGSVPPPGSVRPSNMEPEPQPSGWAAVNANQASKRPFEEPRPSPYESPATGSPKRPRLAPIMPRASYGDESYVPSSMTQSGATESSFHPRSRAPSNSSQSQSQSQSLPTPASANTPAYRFITSTQSADPQESWRPEAERMMHYGHHSHPGHHHHQHHHHPGHGRGRRGGRRGGRGRGGRGGLHIPEPQELDTPEWEKPDWTGTQTSPNGFDNPAHPYSPQDPRGGSIRRSAGAAGGPSDREHELPITPIVQSLQDPFDPANPDSAGQQNSGNKKTRTKPIRNAEGVLIRKDGRPDMRSVSSANNLRKVHAKKEAERAEMDGRTPTSARSLAPANSSSLSEDENVDHSGSPDSPAERAVVKGEERNTQERHQELMSRMFPHGFEGAAGGQSTAERFFPRHDHQEIPEATMKTENEDGLEGAQQTDRSGQMPDVVMREVGEVQAEEHEQGDDDTKMPTVQEEEHEASSAPQETEQAAEQSTLS